MGCPRTTRPRAPAEQRARELLRSCVNDAEWAMYRDLGFIRVEGKRTIPSGPAPYAYLIYPHKPIVSYVPGERPPAERVLRRLPRSRLPRPARPPARQRRRARQVDGAHGDEKRLINEANMHLPGRQVDPGACAATSGASDVGARAPRLATGAKKR
jgi:hypothetical protein